MHVAGVLTNWGFGEGASCGDRGAAVLLAQWGEEAWPAKAPLYAANQLEEAEEVGMESRLDGAAVDRETASAEAACRWGRLGMAAWCWKCALFLEPCQSVDGCDKYTKIVQFLSLESECTSDC
jgi:hypothetical protein